MTAYTLVAALFWIGVIGGTLLACRLIDALTSYVARCRARRQRRHVTPAESPLCPDEGPRPCPDCTAVVRDADLLVRADTHRLCRHDVLIDPDEIPLSRVAPQEHLLLCLTLPPWHGTPVVLSLDDPGAERLAELIGTPHVHRLHVCAAVPTSWTGQRTGAPA